MNQLPETLGIGGFQLTQIHRDGDIAIYRQSKPDQHDSFEVIRIQTHGYAKIPDKKRPEGFREVFPGEHYPGAETWGEHGWTYGQESFARAKLRDLVAQREAQKSETP